MTRIFPTSTYTVVEKRNSLEAVAVGRNGAKSPLLWGEGGSPGLVRACVCVCAGCWVSGRSVVPFIISSPCRSMTRGSPVSCERDKEREDGIVVATMVDVSIETYREDIRCSRYWILVVVRRDEE